MSKVKIRNRVCIPIQGSEACFCTFNGLSDAEEHLAVIFNYADKEKIPLVRVHSECITGDLFHSRRCDCGDQLQEALSKFKSASGILFYLRQEGRGIGLYNKLDAYSLQLQGLDTYESNRELSLPDDMRSYNVAVEMMRALGIDQIRLITNNPDKIKQIKEAGINIIERVGTNSYFKLENKAYLDVKAKKTGHMLREF